MEPRRWSFLLSTLRRLINHFRNYRTSAMCSRSNYTIALSPSSDVQYRTINRLLRLRQPHRHLSPPAAPPSAPPSTARSQPAPISDIWPPPPPPELLLPMAENHAQYHKLFKTCSVVATNYDGRFPFIAFMSRHFQRSYVQPPQAVFHVFPMPKSYHFKDRSQLHPHVPPALF